MLQRIADWLSNRYYNFKTRFDTWRDQRGQTNLVALLQWIVGLAVLIFVVVLLYKLGMAALDKA